jgi:PEP-CTERM motif
MLDLTRSFSGANAMKPFLPLRAAFAAALFSAPASAATALEGGLAAEIRSNLSAGTLFDSDSDVDGWSGGALQSLSVEALTLITDGPDNRLFSNVSSDAVWDSANAGRFVIDEYSWEFKTDTAHAPAEVQFNEHDFGNDWFYSFIADGDGTFTMDIFVSAGGDRNGFRGFDLLVNGVVSSSLLDDDDPSIVKSLSFGLTAGEQYTFALRNDAFRRVNGASNFTGLMTGSFDWRIEEVVSPGGVPEPANWALMIAGLGLAGTALRSANGRHRASIRSQTA